MNFSEFDTEPIASASMAQVYKARLKSGKKVAVKIIRSGTRQIFEDDLMVFEYFGHVMQKQFRENQAMGYAIDSQSNTCVGLL